MAENPIENSFADRDKKSIFIKDLRLNDFVQSSFRVSAKVLRSNRSGAPILSLHLADSTGQIEAEIHSDVDEIDLLAPEGGFVSIAGKVYESGGRRRLALKHIVPIDLSETEKADFFPPTGDTEAQFAELVDTFRGLTNPWISQLGVALLTSPEVASRFPRCPAAKSIHHAHPGGLLRHTLQLIRVVDALAPLYPELDREILIFGATFHDFGKIFELSFENGTEYTDEGKLIGHIPIGTQLIDRAVREIPEFPKDLELQLKHIVLSHHGRIEYGSPKLPQTLEAIVVSAIDDLDSKLDSVLQWMKGENGRGRWTTLHKAYQVSYYRPDFLLDPERKSP